MALAGRFLTEWAGDPGAVTEYNVRFTAVVPVPNDGKGAELWTVTPKGTIAAQATATLM